MKIDLMQLEFIDILLRTISQEIEDEFRVEFTITSLFRIDDDGVHGTLPLRGIDKSCKNKPLGKAVENFVNKRWVYDHKRPTKMCCRFHKTKNGEWHLHIQTHPNTEKRHY